MKSFFSDISVSALSQVVFAISVLLIQIHVTRTVPVAEYGMYAATQAIVTLIEAVFIARGGEVALQYIGRHWNMNMPLALWYRTKLIRLDVKANLLIYAIIVGTGYLMSSTLSFDPLLLAVLALTIPAQIGYGVWKATLIADHRLKEAAQIEIIYSVLVLMLATGLTSMYGIKGLICGLVIGSFFKTLSTRYIALKYWPKDLLLKEPDDDDAIVKASFRQANGHSVFRNAVMNGATQGDIIILNALGGPQSAAVYKVAKTIAAIPVRVSAPVWAAIRPRIMAAQRHGEFDHLRKLLVLPALTLTLIGLTAITLLDSYLPSLIVALYGEQYQAAGPVVFWLLIGTWIFGAVTGWLSFVCVISNRKTAGSSIYMVWLIAILIGGLLWGSKSEINMAMVAAAGMTLSAIAGWLYFTRRSAWIEKIV